MSLRRVCGAAIAFAAVALLPASALAGAVMLLVADTFARTLAAPAEVPIGILCALVGAPFFLGILLRQRSLVGL